MLYRRKITALAAALITAIALSPATGAVASVKPTTAMPGPQIASGQITSGYSGQCLDDHQGSIAVGNPLDAYACNQNYASQLWTAEADGTLQLQGNHCVGITSGQVVLNACDTDATQKWLPQSNGTLKNSGTGTCLYASSSTATSLTLTTCSTSGSPPSGQVWTEPAVTTASQTASAMVPLQVDYDSSSSTPGLFCSIGNTSAPGGNCWWWSANELRTVVDYLQRNSGAVGYSHYASDISTTYGEGYYDHSTVTCVSGSTATPAAFENGYFDDTAWWGLTWLDAYELTGTTKYLTLAENIFQYIHNCGAESAGTSCGNGGVVQYTNSSGPGPVDTIATALYITLGARLAVAAPSSQSGDLSDSSNKGAADEMGWLMHDSTLPVVYLGEPWNSGGEYLMNDGLGSCPSSPAQKYTYNQGQTIGALTALYEAGYGSSPGTYLTEAENLANTVPLDTPTGSGDTGQLSTPPDVVVLSGGQDILSEPCSPATASDWPNTCDVQGNTGSNDFLQFKGVYVRNLFCLAQQANPGSAYTGFLANNAASVWANDQDTTTTQGAADLNQFGFVWSHFYPSYLGLPTQGAAADALIAAEGGTALSC